MNKLNRRVGGSIASLDACREYENLLALPGIEPLIAQPVNYKNKQLILILTWLK